MFERFTERARHVVVLAQEEARSLKHEYIGTEHLLLGLLRENEGIAAKVLDAVGVTEIACRDIIRREVGEGQERITGQIPFTPRCQKALELALREALSLGHNYIGTEHVLLGLVREHEGLGATILAGLNVDGETVRNEAITLLNRGGSNAGRWAEYVICQQRGHVPRDPAWAKQQCVHCGTTFWTETVQRESGAPVEPQEERAA
jgi:ATP-dependent Clp protease ATP-binding subunit ClpC